MEGTPEGDAAAQFPVLYATLSQQGSIVISRSTHEKMGAPEAYVVMFDPLRHRIGLQAESSDNPNAYRARKQGRSGAKIIRAHRMIREFGIQPPDTLEFPEAKIVDGVLYSPSNGPHIAASTFTMQIRKARQTSEPVPLREVNFLFVCYYR